MWLLFVSSWNWYKMSIYMFVIELERQHFWHSSIIQASMCITLMLWLMNSYEQYNMIADFDMILKVTSIAEPIIWIRRSNTLVFSASKEFQLSRHLYMVNAATGFPSLNPRSWLTHLIRISTLSCNIMLKKILELVATGSPHSYNNKVEEYLLCWCIMPLWIKLLKN